jgi:hypothetical protein
VYGSADFLNPDAGTHPVTTDPAELAAAARAGARTWAQFPYFEQRFAERGRKFCTSDTAWLLTLGHRERKPAVDQVLWLGRVLSARGMPRYLLEQHLHNVVAELGVSAGRNLRAGERKLRALRRQYVAQDAFDELAGVFNARVAGVQQGFGAMGELLVSAVADEASGIERALISVEEWACDAARFPAEWIDAVRATIGDARSALSSRP